MPELYIPESTEEKNEDEEGQIVVNYEPTQEDEEKFFLMYNLNVQPGECNFDVNDVEKRRWLIARFMMQKNAERQQMMEQRQAAMIAQGLDLGNLKS